MHWRRPRRGPGAGTGITDKGSTVIARTHEYPCSHWHHHRRDLGCAGFFACWFMWMACRPHREQARLPQGNCGVCSIRGYRRILWEQAPRIDFGCAQYLRSPPNPVGASSNNGFWVCTISTFTTKPCGSKLQQWILGVRNIYVHHQTLWEPSLLAMAAGLSVAVSPGKKTAPFGAVRFHIRGFTCVPPPMISAARCSSRFRP